MSKVLLALVGAALLMLTGTGAAQALPTGLSTTQSCTGNTASITFTWRGIGASSREVWIDLTTNNHWRAGTYLSAGPIAAGETSYVWTGIKPNEQHFYRITEQLAGGAWVPSVTSSFTAACGSAVASGATADEQSYRNRATAQLYALTVRLSQRSRGVVNPSLPSVLNDFVAALKGLEPAPPRFRDVHNQLRNVMVETSDCFVAPLSVCDDDEFDELLDELDDAMDDYQLVVGVDLPVSR